MVKRRKTTQIRIGDVHIGSKFPISIQSMCNTKTIDVKNTINQIIMLEKAGCNLIRLAIPDLESAQAIKKIKTAIHIPIIADIHFDHKLAIAALRNGVDAIRINPGNIGSQAKIKSLVEHLQERQIPIRIGVNSGSIPNHLLQKFGVSAQSIVESALEHIRILEDLNYNQIKISVKASSVPLTIEAYKQLAKQTKYPFHIGITESGTEFTGSIKSAIGIGTLLAQGIGDTLRVSLTSDPLQEIKVGKTILQALELQKGLNIISCPTCGRTNIPLISLANEVEKQLLPYQHLNITVAIMGCEVNGPGEAKEADYGIAGGKNEGLLFKKGTIIAKIPAEKLVESLINQICNDIPIFMD